MVIPYYHYLTQVIPYYHYLTQFYDFEAICLKSCLMYSTNNYLLRFFSMIGDYMYWNLRYNFNQTDFDRLILVKESTGVL